jgi:UrcA family protein
MRRAPGTCITYQSPQQSRHPLLYVKDGHARGASIMSTIVTRTVLSFGLVCVLAAAPALAEPGIPSVSVRTADFDVTTSAGEQALRNRVARAVRFVCGDNDQRDLEAWMEQRACRATALSKALPQVQIAIAKVRTRNAYTAEITKAGRPAS